MPIYEYRCEECSTEFEELVRASTRDSDIRCPACQQRKARRRVSTFAVSTPSAATTSAGGGGCGSSGFT